MFKNLLKTFLYLIPFLFCWPTAQAATKSLHHDLQVSLFPSEKRMSGTDRLSVKPDHVSELSFNLSQKTYVIKVEVNGRPVSFTFRDGRLHVPLRTDERHNVVSVSIRYEGIFDDPIPESPLNTDNPSYGVTGIISEKGCFLQAGSGWHPEIPGSQPTYRLRVDAPAGVLAVSVGKCLGHETKEGRTSSIWEVKHPMEGLSLSAARYVVKERAAGSVRAATYFFPGSAHLAEGYLNASIRYITFYEELFGPYPFDKFAIVENFFPTGYGFPSYTLLGSRVIRLPFIIHTSLAHEIAHCWWGNGVYVDYEKGNWSEGLTTYVADYLHKEKTSVEEAREYRLQILRKFATLVNPQKDFPLRWFQSRYDPASQAIGYGKGAMVFHMLRQQLGDNAFWEALKDVYKERLFQNTSWDDFQKAFERHCQCSLQRFFDQWLSQEGAPQLSLKGIRSKRKGNTWQVRGRIAQRRPLYTLQMNLALESGRQRVTKKIKVSGKETPFEITSDGSPVKLTVDPNFDIFRHLYPSEIPPSINSVKGSSSVVVVLAKRSWPSVQDTVRTLTRSLGLKNFKILSDDQIQAEAMMESDMVVVGFPKTKEIISHLPPQVAVGREGIILNEKTYDHPSVAFFGVFAHPFVEGRVMALFLPLSMKYARQVARKITHYGKYSYLVFSQGRIQEKGIWPISDSPLTYKWDGHGDQR